MTAKTNEERISLRTRLSRESREMLAMCPANELRPLQLTTWVQRLVSAARQDGVNDFETVKLIRQFAKDGHWSEGQIKAIIYDFRAGYFDRK
jgi:hypothetical protein